MLNDLFLVLEERRLCGEECIFYQDNAGIDNSSIPKKYVHEQKIRPFDHLAYPPDLNPIENL